MAVRELPIKVVYTINRSPHAVVARSKRVPTTLTPSPDKDAVVYCKVSLRDCLQAICQASPELVLDRKRDFTVYVLDPLEQAPTPFSHPSGVASSSKSDQTLPAMATAGAPVGMGLMSWGLAADGEYEYGDAEPVCVVGKLITHPASGEMVEVVVSLLETRSQTQQQHSDRLKSWAPPAVSKPSKRQTPAPSNKPNKRPLPTPRSTSSPAPSTSRQVVDLTGDDPDATDATSLVKKKPVDAKKPKLTNADSQRPSQPLSAPYPTPRHQSATKSRANTLPSGSSPVPHAYPPYPAYPGYYWAPYNGAVQPAPARPNQHRSTQKHPTSDGGAPPNSNVVSAAQPADTAASTPGASTSSSKSGGKVQSNGRKQENQRSSSARPALPGTRPQPQPVPIPSSSSALVISAPDSATQPPSSQPSETSAPAEKENVSPDATKANDKKRRLDSPDDDEHQRKKLNSDERVVSRAVHDGDLSAHPPPAVTPSTPKREPADILDSSPLFSPQLHGPAPQIPTTPARGVSGDAHRIFGSAGMSWDGLFDNDAFFSPLRNTPGTSAALLQMGLGPLNTSPMLSSSPIARNRAAGESPWKALRIDMGLLPPSSPLPPTSSPVREIPGALDGGDEEVELDVKQESPLEQLLGSAQESVSSSEQSQGIIDPALAIWNAEDMWAELGPLIVQDPSKPSEDPAQLQAKLEGLTEGHLV